MQNSSRLPFLQYAENRELRKNIYEAYINRGNHDDANDNKEILGKIMALRLEQAKLLGFDCYSNFVLDENMAKNSQTVMDFLNRKVRERSWLHGTGGIMPKNCVRKSMI